MRHVRRVCEPIDGLLDANRDLFVVSVLRDALKDLCGHRNVGLAARITGPFVDVVVWPRA